MADWRLRYCRDWSSPLGQMKVLASPVVTTPASVGSQSSGSIICTVTLRLLALFMDCSANGTPARLVSKNVLHLPFDIQAILTAGADVWSDLLLQDKENEPKRTKVAVALSFMVNSGV